MSKGKEDIRKEYIKKLFIAIEEGKIKKAIKYLKQRLVNIRDRDQGESILSFAASEGQDELVKFLLANGLKNDKKELKEALINAIGSGNIDTVGILIEAIENNDAFNSEDLHELLEDVEESCNNRPETTERLILIQSKIKEKEDKAQGGKSGEKPNDELAISSSLSESSDNKAPNKAPEKNQQPSKNNSSAENEPESKEEKNRGFENYQKEPKKDKAGYKPSRSKKRDESPIVIAAAKGSVEEVRKLVADANKQDKDRAVFYAIVNNHENVMTLLLDEKADINYQNKSGRTSLDYVIDNRPLASFLISKGAITGKKMQKAIAQSLQQNPLAAAPQKADDKKPEQPSLNSEEDKEALALSLQLNKQKDPAQSPSGQPVPSFSNPSASPLENPEKDKDVERSGP